MDDPRSPSIGEEPDSYDVKELFIESCIREWREGYFLEVVSPNSLETMSMLESSALDDFEAGAPLYSGPDLFASLHHEMTSKSREQWLAKYITARLQDADFRTKVDACFDEDLRAAGMQHLIGGGRRMVEKARAIAEYRLKRNVSSTQQPNQSVGAGTLKTFKVTLKTLIGGHGGLLQESNLYFDYGTSFPFFLTMLRDATKLSTIPPIDLDEESAAKREISLDARSDTTSQLSSTYSPSGPNPQPKPHSSSARGYTIADGPWLYRFSCESTREGGTTYVELKDDQSFLKMMNEFKQVTRNDQSNKYTVLLIHSTDRTAHVQWREKERQDEKAEEHFRENCLRDLASAIDKGDVSSAQVLIDLDKDDNDVGESYMEWLSKDIARQKKEHEIARQKRDEDIARQKREHEIARQKREEDIARLRRELQKSLGKN